MLPQPLPLNTLPQYFLIYPEQLLRNFPGQPAHHQNTIYKYHSEILKTTRLYRTTKLKAVLGA